jgi:N-acetylneuraminic acid mutarotase
MDMIPAVGRSRRRRSRFAWLTVSVAAVTTMALAAPGVAAGAAVPVAAPGAAAAPAPLAAAGNSSPPTGKRSAKRLCSKAVTRDQARCFALVMETNGVVPNLAQPTGLTPNDVKSAYVLPDGGGAGAVIGIVDAFDDPNAEADLAVYRAQFGLPPLAAGQFRKVDQRGGTNYPPPDAGWAGEISLDLDAVTAVAPNASIVLVEADTNSIDDLGTAVNQAVAQGAKYVSNSYGSDYTATPGSGEDSSDIPLDAQYYDHPGVVVTASTGDGGFGVSFPASSPHVTSVGGTTLVPDSSSPRGWSETVWNNSFGGPGSGCSIIFDKPTFQTDSGCAKRSLADVSAVADPVTGLAVYDTFSESGWLQVGGTSLSSPLVAAVYALAGAPVTDSYPVSYPYRHPEALNDITAGSNGSCSPSYECTAGPGYDGPTGLGTPNGLLAFAAGPRGTITGTITDAASATPLANVAITATSADSAASTTTAADGTYSLSVPPGSYTITASLFGYSTETSAPVTVVDGGSVTAELALTKLAVANLSGTVTDGSGHGYPLYATITIDGVPGGPIHTDPFTGHYSVDLPVGTTYRLTFVSNYPGYLPDTESIDVGSVDKVQDVQLNIDPSLDSVPGYTLAATGTTQTFDGTTTPAGWTVTNNTAAGGWEFDDPHPRGNLTGGSGGFAIVDSDFLGIGNTEDTYLTSPVVDLSAATSPILTFDTLYRDLNSVAEVQLSTDGGATWSNIWSANGSDVSGHIKVPLGDSAKTSTVQVRFHYTGTWAWYWEVDNVFVGSMTFQPIHGGILAGIVTDANTGAGVNSATITSDTDEGLSTTTHPTGDPAVGDGFYEMFSPLVGRQGFTASKHGYGPLNEPATVGANTTTRLDFSLPAGQVSVKQSSIALTVAWGTSKSASLKLTNTGGLPATVGINEQAGGFVLAAEGGAPLQVIKTATNKGSAELTAKKAGIQQAPGASPTATPSADAWQPVADYPTTIQDDAAVTGNGILYAVDGYDGSGDTSALNAYDVQAGAWNTLTPAADTREAPAAGFVGGRLVVSGGWGSSGDTDGKTEIYDPSSDSWTTGATNPAPLAGSGHAVLGGKLYAIGGCSASSCGSTSVMVYDASSDSWSTAAAYPEPVAWEACGGIAGLIYCAGGTTDAASITHAYSYDPGSDSWSPIADLPTDLWGSFSTAANGQLLVAGGVTQNSSAITNQGYAYDPGTGEWSALPNLNAALYRGSGAVGFYAVGGNPGGFLAPPVATVEVLPGFDQGGSSDVPWLSESESTLTLAPGTTATVSVTVNAADPSVVQPGVYTAGLTFTTDTPYRVPDVAVSMTVKPPKTWGKIAGTVTAAATGAPIPGATVEIDSWAASYTLTTGKDGGYALWLDKRNNPLTMIVAKDGFKPQTAKVKVVAGATVIKNWALVKR